MIKDLIGYDPDRLCLEFIRRADNKWNERKGNFSQQPEPFSYRRKTSNLLTTWNMLWYNNLLYSQCKTHNTLNTRYHIQSFHNSKIPPNLSTILYEAYELHEKEKKSKSKRRGRFIKLVQKKIEAHETIFKHIVEGFNRD